MVHLFGYRGYLGVLTADDTTGDTRAVCSPDNNWDDPDVDKFADVYWRTNRVLDYYDHMRLNCDYYDFEKLDTKLPVKEAQIVNMVSSSSAFYEPCDPDIDQDGDGYCPHKIYYKTLNENLYIIVQNPDDSGLPAVTPIAHELGHIFMHQKRTEYSLEMLPKRGEAGAVSEGFAYIMAAAATKFTEQEVSPVTWCTMYVNGARARDLSNPKSRRALLTWRPRPW